MPGNRASPPAGVVRRVPGVHQPHFPLPLHRRDAYEDVCNVILGEKVFPHNPLFEMQGFWIFCYANYYGIVFL